MKHKSYKLKDDSLEIAIRNLNLSLSDKVTLQDKIKAYDNLIKEYTELIVETKSRIVEAEEEIKEKEAKVVELLRRNKKPIVVDCVKYSLIDDKLNKEIISFTSSRNAKKEDNI